MIDTTYHQRPLVLSLYDYTGEAVRPWAEAGFRCHCYDIQHDGGRIDVFPSGGSISYLHADLHNRNTLVELAVMYRFHNVAFGMAFPVCTDLAVSGAAHFARKAEVDPDFQKKAASYAMWCGVLFDTLKVPYFVENPVSRLATLWRKPDHSFHPHEYGGYIPEDQAEHPTWPEYIAPRDAYTKKTCLWTGGGFQMPEKRSVDPIFGTGGRSIQDAKLGGKSLRTKNIRSATPRGFARAVFTANAPFVGDNQSANVATIPLRIAV